MATSTYPKSSNFTPEELEVLRDAQYGFSGIEEYNHCVRVKEVFGNDIYFMRFKHWAVSKDYSTILSYSSWESDCSNRPHDYYNSFTNWCENYIPLELVEHDKEELNAAIAHIKRYRFGNRPHRVTLLYCTKKVIRETWRGIKEEEKMWKNLMRHPSRCLLWWRTGIIY